MHTHNVTITEGPHNLAVVKLPFTITTQTKNIDSKTRDQYPYIVWLGNEAGVSIRTPVGYSVLQEFRKHEGNIVIKFIAE